MGILETLRTSLSPRPRLLRRLAALAGESERLAATIKHHAELCELQALKYGLATASRAEAADAYALRTMLRPYDVSPASAMPAVIEGSSNWARIAADLAAEVELVRGLNAAAAQCEGAEPALAERLRELALAKDQTLGLLRDLALRADPQALD